MPFLSEREIRVRTVETQTYMHAHSHTHTHTHIHIHNKMGGVSITLMKRLIIKFMRAGVTKPHHSAAMRQVVKEMLTVRLSTVEDG